MVILFYKNVYYNIHVIFKNFFYLNKKILTDLCHKDDYLIFIIVDYNKGQREKNL